MDERWTAGRGNQRRRRAAAGPEQADRQSAGALIRVQPIDRGQHAVGQQADVEAQVARDPVDCLLVAGQKIEQEGGVAVLPQTRGDEAVARAEPAAAAAMRERDHPGGTPRAIEVRLEEDTGWNDNWRHVVASQS